ncbi:DEAD/DEAH box helicase [Clostridium sp. DJ247]|uniref:DEAD/DEAH box helicase n=1 Tax=Clostridium sp. DJ247 TaxID=2726188 RepID=UPI001627D5C0|nr:DEAD/DEAH box helicase [Clostridium sp. DJ247]MBC2580845.1 DEAD/DEAH box helicase [Clostridium sp. DJ247]
MNDKGQLIDKIYCDMRRDNVKVAEIANIDEDSNKLIEKITNEFDEKMRGYNSAITSKQQLKFAKDVAAILVNDLIDAGKTVIVPAKAGFGKSTVIKIAAFNIINKSQGFGSQQGLIIASDKIKNLKTYMESIGEKYCYLIDSQGELPVKMQFAEQYRKPILLISTQRLKMMGDNIKVFSEYKNERDEYCNRTMLIIDEKPELLDSQRIDQKFISDIRNSIENIKIKDKNIDLPNKELLKGLLQELDATFIKLTKEYADKEFYVHKADGRCLTSNDDLLFSLSDKYLDYDTVFKIEHVKRLVITLGGLWYNKIHLGNNHQFFRTLGIMNYSYNFKTIIFDATAEIDLEYHDSSKYIFLKIDDDKKYNHVNIYNYDNIHFSKSSLITGFGNNKKIESFSKFITNKFKDINGKIYLTTFNESVKVLKNTLEKTDLMKHIVLDENGKIPHYGGTKGQNLWGKCNTAILLGIYSQTEDIYTSMAVSYYFLEIFKEANAETLTEVLNYTSKGYSTSRLNLFRLTKILVDLEQDIYRCAIRNYNSSEPINIYTFGLNKIGTNVYQPEIGKNYWSSLLGKISSRVKGANIIEVEEVPPELDKVLNYGNGDSIIGNLIRWVKEYEGTPILVSEFKKMFGISQKYFEKIFSNSATDKSIMQFQNVWKSKNIQKKANRDFGKGKWIYI